MKSVELTCRSRAATTAAMAIIGALALSGCISVNAPDKPIVIELNMNITMDVVYKLSGDATKTVDTNKDIF
jgi:hypothetical protein